MARIWREYVAPDGRKYYYNTVTKQSTWKKPEFLDELDENREMKRFKKIESNPHLALELYHHWNLIICDTGKRFYYNADSNESVVDLPDEASRNLIDVLDKNKLVALIGLARGYPHGGLHIYDELLADLKRLKKENEVSEAGEAGEAGEDEQTDEKDRKEATEGDESQKEDEGEDTDSKTALVAGYSSSSDDEAEDEDEAAAEEPLSVPIMESVEEHVDSSENKKALLDLFSRYELNPYSAWPFEMKKVRDDPDFLRVLDDSVREDIFEEWCAQTIAKDSGEPLIETGSNEGFGTEDEEEDEEDLEPTKFHYLAQIVSKSTITPTTIFMDIKNENKSLFKKYGIKTFVSSKKDQESFVSKLLYYYKRMSLEERKEVFIRLLNHNKEIIEKELSRDVENKRHVLNQEIDTNDPYAVETKLFKMEKFMGLCGNLSHLVEEPQYYILGIREKMLELKNYLETYVELH